MSTTQKPASSPSHERKPASPPPHDEHKQHSGQARPATPEREEHRHREHERDRNAPHKK